MDATFVPIIAIGGGIALALFRTWAKFQQTKLELMGTQTKLKTDDALIADLRREIMHVRSVGSEYDLSIQHTLDQIQQRLDRVESQLASSPPYASRQSAETSPEKIATLGQDRT